MVDEANEDLKKKLKELQDEIEEDIDDNDAEERRRRRHPERGRNMDEQEGLDGDREDLDNEDERIAQKEDQLDFDDEVDDLLDQDLREAEQEARGNGDPNCRSSACQQIRGQRANLQGRRVDRLHDRTDVQKSRDDYQRRDRAWRNQNNDLQARLDRGEGMTHDERRLRNARTAYREWADERGRLESEIRDLENRQRTRRTDGGRLSWQEQEHLNDLKDQARQLNRHTDIYNDLDERINVGNKNSETATEGRSKTGPDITVKN